MASPNQTEAQTAPVPVEVMEQDKMDQDVADMEQDEGARASQVVGLASVGGVMLDIPEDFKQALPPVQGMTMEKLGMVVTQQVSTEEAPAPAAEEKAPTQSAETEVPPVQTEEAPMQVAESAETEVPPAQTEEAATAESVEPAAKDRGATPRTRFEKTLTLQARRRLPTPPPSPGAQKEAKTGPQKRKRQAVQQSMAVPPPVISSAPTRKLQARRRLATPAEPTPPPLDQPTPAAQPQKPVKRTRAPRVAAPRAARPGKRMVEAVKKVLAMPTPGSMPSPAARSMPSPAARLPRGATIRPVVRPRPVRRGLSESSSEPEFAAITPVARPQPKQKVQKQGKARRELASRVMSSVTGKSRKPAQVAKKETQGAKGKNVTKGKKKAPLSPSEDEDTDSSDSSDEDSSDDDVYDPTDSPQSNESSESSPEVVTKKQTKVTQKSNKPTPAKPSKQKEPIYSKSKEKKQVEKKAPAVKSTQVTKKEKPAAKVKNTPAKAPAAKKAPVAKKAGGKKRVPTSPSEEDDSFDDDTSDTESEDSEDCTDSPGSSDFDSSPEVVAKKKPAKTIQKAKKLTAATGALPLKKKGAKAAAHTPEPASAMSPFSTISPVNRMPLAPPKQGSFVPMRLERRPLQGALLRLPGRQPRAPKAVLDEASPTSSPEMVAKKPAKTIQKPQKAKKAVAAAVSKKKTTKATGKQTKAAAKPVPGRPSWCSEE